MLLLPPDKPDPMGKAMVDAYLESKADARSKRAWSFWLTVGALSVGALWCVRYDFFPNVVRVSLALVGGLGLLLFLGFLSTKPFGRGYYAGPEWWWF